MSRNHALDGLRGLAALAVAFAHCNLAIMGPGPWAATARDFPALSGAEIASSLLYVAAPGHAAVTLFFVLSGHVLWGSFRRKQPGSLGDMPDYALGRGYRLLPVAIASAVPLAFLSDASIWEVVANMLLLSHSINGVLWSLQVEAVCSIAIFLAWLLARGSPGRLAIVLVAVLLVSPAFRGSNFFLFFPAFLLGAAIYDVPETLWTRRSVLIAGAAGLVLAHILIPHAVSRHVEMLCATALVGSVAKRPPAFLLSRPVRFLGAISYPLYLSHPTGLTLAAAFGIGAGSGNPFARMALLVLFSVPVAIAMAWLLHVAVERPAMRARARLAQAALRSRPAASRESLPEPS
jgi:peptidoglycan/LPS O-acetylase OafA/YrhL